MWIIGGAVNFCSQKSRMPMTELVYFSFYFPDGVVKQRSTTKPKGVKSPEPINRKPPKGKLPAVKPGQSHSNL